MNSREAGKSGSSHNSFGVGLKPLILPASVFLLLSEDAKVKHRRKFAILFTEHRAFLSAWKQPGSTYHICAIHWRGHLDLPEMLPICQLLVAPDGCGATAVLHVEVHLAVVTGQQGGRRLIQVIPYPVKIWSGRTQETRMDIGPQGAIPK